MEKSKKANENGKNGLLMVVVVAMFFLVLGLYLGALWQRRELQKGMIWLEDVNECLREF